MQSKVGTSSLTFSVKKGSLLARDNSDEIRLVISQCLYDEMSNMGGSKDEKESRKEERETRKVRRKQERNCGKENGE